MAAIDLGDIDMVNIRLGKLQVRHGHDVCICLSYFSIRKFAPLLRLTLIATTTTLKNSHDFLNLCTSSAFVLSERKRKGERMLHLNSMMRCVYVCSVYVFMCVLKNCVHCKEM